jgi:hypothetical protein
LHLLAAASSNSLLGGSPSGIQPPRIAMQRIWTARQDNFASKKNITKSQNLTKAVMLFINLIIF